MPAPERLRIVHVTPHPWGTLDEINDYAGKLAGELQGRGHEVLVAAPSESRARVRVGRAAIREALDHGGRIDGRWRGDRRSAASGWLSGQLEA